ncbi:MAG: gephyrin-like molybdotransferase Glp [Pseudomonadota bacterium]
MITVAEALAQVLPLAPRPEVETVPLRQARGRVLAQAVSARLTQPPFAASAMDGYAVATAEVAPGDAFHVIGEAAAGHPYHGTLGPGQAVRIFTGGEVPPGGKRVIIQEDVQRDGDQITLHGPLDTGPHIRPAGGDFAQGTHVSAPRSLDPAHIALLAAMGHSTLPVARRPEIALLMTGDELRAPDAIPGPGEIIGSNGYGLAALFEAQGAIARLLPIARDTPESLDLALDLAQGADVLVTIGGASVGDHDLVATTLRKAGAKMAFHGIRMRPGKPLMAGRLKDMSVIGLPGNPVSSFVCSILFVLPMIRRALGLSTEMPELRLRLTNDLGPNGPRQHYMRAKMDGDGGVLVADNQDSSLLSVLARSDALVIRPPKDAAKAAGDTVRVLPLP